MASKKYELAKITNLFIEDNRATLEFEDVEFKTHKCECDDPELIAKLEYAFQKQCLIDIKIKDGKAIEINLF